MLLGRHNGLLKNVITSARCASRPLQLISPFHGSSVPRSYKYGPFTVDDEAFVPRPEPNPDAKNIAVLGGGITGLTTAYNLSKSIPQAKVTILEASSRLGGWVDSEIIKVDDGQVAFEWGPRNLRPDLERSGLATAQLLDKLNLRKQVVAMHRRSPAALNRYIYYPDHLVRMPRPPVSPGLIGRLTTAAEGLWTLLREPIFSRAVSSILAEVAVKPRQSGLADESVGGFLERRFGRPITENLASAFYHGVYAGDIYKLSARTLLPVPWYLEGRDPDGGSVLAELGELIMKKTVLVPETHVEFSRHLAGTKDAPNSSLLYSLSQASVYTFVEGLTEMTKRLQEDLRRSENISIRTDTAAEKLSFDAATKQTHVTTSGAAGQASHTFDYVVSTLPPSLLQASTTEPSTSTLATSLAKCNIAATVMVVNLYYTNPDLIPADKAGFGYLLPRSVSIEQNPERALGVIFGSFSSGPRGQDAYCKDESIHIPDREELEELRTKLKADLERATADNHQPAISLLTTALEKVGQDIAQNTSDTDSSVRPQYGQDTAPGTKLTVMLGGHWWSDWSDSDLPSEDEAVQMSLSVLARHMKIFEQPAVAKAKLARKAIPQYPVGYRQHMATVHSAIMDQFQGRLKVAGPWYQGGVGVNDCVKKAREVALYIREGWDGCTGLQDYTRPEVWYLGDRATGRMKIDD